MTGPGLALDRDAPSLPALSPAYRGEERWRSWRVLMIAAIIFSSLSIWGAIKSDGFLEADACTHYQYARFALGEPHYLVNVWGRPFVTAIYAIPAVLSGRIGVRLTSLACALLVALAAYRIAKKLDYRWPALAFVFVLAQPLVFLHSFSELTELPFAVLLSLAFWAYVQRRWFAMALVVAFLPTARPEGFGFLLLAAMALIAHRRWWWLVILPLPLLIWTWAGWHIYGSPVYTDALAKHVPANWHWLLWLRHEWPYAEKSTYASGYLLWFVALLPVVVSPLLLPFMFIGTARSLRWRALARDHFGRCQMLIALIPMMILTVHSLLYWLGRMASNGEVRYMLVVAPFWGLLSAKGWEWIWEQRRWTHPFAWAAVAALAPIVSHFYYPVLPLHMSHDGVRAQAAARWYRANDISIDYPRMLASNPEVAYQMGVSNTDRGWLREWKKESAAVAPAGTIMIWDPIYALHNADADRVVTIEEIRRAGWIERPDLAEPLNAVYGDGNWRVFLSPKSIFGKASAN